MKIRLTLPFTALFIAAFLLAACGGGQVQTEFKVGVKDEFKFDPAEITVKPGQEVTIVFNNSGAVEHSFNVLKAGEELEHVVEDIGDEEHLHEALMFDIHETAAGASESGTFTAPSDPGDYIIACLVPGHVEAGMVGTLKVVP